MDSVIHSGLHSLNVNLAQNINVQTSQPVRYSRGNCGRDVDYSFANCNKHKNRVIEIRTEIEIEKITEKIIEMEIEKEKETVMEIETDKIKIKTEIHAR